tara:strand:+ start:271 stop:591 length:321 start_codon:yes stop_codon:yes gene_type:complete
MDKLVVDQSLLSGDGVIQLSSETIDPGLQAIDLTILLAGCCFSAGVSVTEQIDVVLIFVLNQTSQVLVIEALAIAGDYTGDFVVVQIDLNLVACFVQEGVKMFCFA